MSQSNEQQANEDDRAWRLPPEGFSPTLAPDLDEVFAPRPVLPGENASTYDELLGSAIATAQPVDTIEMIWVRNAVDLIWEAQRLRRWKGVLLAEIQRRAVAATIPLSPELTAQWRSGEAAAAATVMSQLAEQGVACDELAAKALLSNLTEFERIERMIAAADARWERALFNIPRRRETLAYGLRRFAERAIRPHPSHGI